MRNGTFIKNPSENVVEEIAKWFGFLATDPIRLDIDECHHLVSGAHNVLLVEGSSESVGRMEKAIGMAEQEACLIAPKFDILSADKYMIQICGSKECPIMMDELASVQRFMSSVAENANVSWGLSEQESGDKICIRVAASNLKQK